MQVSDLLVRCLENEGVRYVFGLPGEEIQELLFSLEQSPITFVPTRHEQGAAFMADVWGRVSGQAGVCLATLGPGATNLVTGLADATLDKSPVVAITGQAHRGRMHQESHQVVDVVSMFRPITKWNAAVPSAEAVPEAVRKAFKVAQMEKPGATHIELSEDLARETVAAEPLPVREPLRSSPHAGAVEQAAALIAACEKPLVLAGNGAIRQHAFEALRRFAGQFNLPVAHTFMGQGAVSDRGRQSLHTLGLGLRDIVMDAVDEADAIIAVGYDLEEYAPRSWNPRRDKRIIHIDTLAADVYSHYVPEVEIIADIGAAIEALHGRLLDAGYTCESCARDWYRPVQERIRADIASYALREGAPLTVPGVLLELRALMADDDLLISDVGTHKIWIARNYATCCPNGCIISNGLASMGIALPGGIAAALHDPSRRIVTAMGDGGFLMNSQELETAKRLGVAFTALVFNDNDYGLISWKQQISRGRSTGTRIGNPDFKRYAESFGVRAYQPRDLASLRRDLRSALEGRELCVIAVDVDARVNAELYEKLQLNSQRSPG